MTAHFEVVRSDADQPWHVRLVAANGETVFTSEQYADKRDAENAAGMLGLSTTKGSVSLPVTYVDERTAGDES